MSALRLYCLPYSGASAMVYSRWQRRVPSWLKIQPLELPGRGKRMDESLHREMQPLIAQLAAEIRSELHTPYALFGHSLGALVAYELAQELHAQGCPAPRALIASGTAAPSRRDEYREKYLHPKSDEELITELRELQGTTEDVLNNRELMDLTLPILRADFLICGNYQYRQVPKLNIPVHVFGGKTDKADMPQLLAWGEETTGPFALRMFDGGHFFIHEHEAQVIEQLSNYLGELVHPVSNHVVFA